MQNKEQPIFNTGIIEQPIVETENIVIQDNVPTDVTNNNSTGDWNEVVVFSKEDNINKK
jgi:hypothetical protein